MHCRNASNAVQLQRKGVHGSHQYTLPTTNKWIKLQIDCGNSIFATMLSTAYKRLNQPLWPQMCQHTHSLSVTSSDNSLPFRGMAALINELWVHLHLAANFGPRNPVPAPCSAERECTGQEVQSLWPHRSWNVNEQNVPRAWTWETWYTSVVDHTCQKAEMV